MAALFGTLRGGRQSVTRTGTKNSGIQASLQSWKGSVIPAMYLKEEDNTPIVSLDIAEGSSSYGSNYFSGTLDEFKEMCEMYRAVKSGKKILVDESVDREDK